MVDGQFIFTVFEGDTVAARGTNTAAGNIIFSEITYTQPGVYTYTVKETSKSAGGMVTDDTVYTVTVTVTDNGDGTMTALASYPEGGIVFRNTYAPLKEINPQNVSFRIHKKLYDLQDNETGAGKKFAVRLYDSDMNLIDRIILSANGAGVTFSGLESGTTYYLQEEKGTGYNVLGFDVIIGGEKISSKVGSAIGIKIPKYENELEIEVVLKNSAYNLEEIPDETPPLSPYDPPEEEPPLIEIPDELIPLSPGPGTGDNGMDIHYLLILMLASVLIIRKTATKKKVN